MLPNNNGNGKQNGFIIVQHLDYLVPNPKKRGQYLCPHCGSDNFSINKDGVQYYCWSCQNTDAIAYTLMEKAGTLNQQKTSSFSSDSNIKTAKKSTSSKNKDKEENKYPRLTHQLAVNEFVEKYYKDGLKYNQRTDMVEFLGKEIDLDLVRFDVARDSGVDAAKEALVAAFKGYALKASYDPVKEFLERCRKENFINVNQAISLIIKSENELYITYFRKLLIAAVARVYEPGSKFDNTLILHGKQGIGKSTLWNVLCGGHFSDSMSGQLSENDLRILNGHWFCEWAELDSFTARDYNLRIKAFLSASTDTYRLPYDRKMTTAPRRSVIVGTTNRDDFLKDPTGNRRFWVIPIKGRIALDYVEEIKFQLWGSILSLYEDGEEWTLPEKFWGMQQEESENYTEDDVWESYLLEYLKGKESCDLTLRTIIEGLENKLPTISQARNVERRLGSLLRRNGWSKRQARVNGDNIKVWSKD